jgi:hypothetical protein
LATRLEQKPQPLSGISSKNYTYKYNKYLTARHFVNDNIEKDLTTFWLESSVL